MNDARTRGKVLCQDTRLTVTFRPTLTLRDPNYLIVGLKPEFYSGRPTPSAPPGDGPVRICLKSGTPATTTAYKANTSQGSKKENKTST